MNEEKPNEVKEVAKELIDLEGNKVFRTLHHLTTRPGQMIAEYCQGGKNKYLSPVTYFVGVTAVEGFIASSLGLIEFVAKKNTEDLSKTFSDPAFSKLGIDASTISDKLNVAGSFLMSETGQKVTIIPIVLLFTWLFYKKYNRSFKESSWFALYTLGHVTLLTLPVMLYWYFTKDLAVYSAIGLIFSSLYWIWASMQFYSLSIGRAIFLRVAFLVTILLVFSIATTTIMLLYLLSSS